jgi:Tc5 transposase DNA-binding domain
MLVQWILDLERQGYAPTHSQLREMRISLNSDGPDKISKNWISRFLKRHLNVCTKIGRNIDAFRVKRIEKEILRK